MIRDQFFQQARDFTLHLLKVLLPDICQPFGNRMGSRRLEAGENFDELETSGGGGAASRFDSVNNRLSQREGTDRAEQSQAHGGFGLGC